MTGRLPAEVRELLVAAVDLYRDDPAAETLRSYRRRLDEPLRVAVAGMVKAGKSTLLNAILGEEIAPTDAGECTTVVTWYRYGTTPRVTLHPLEGAPRPLPVRREDGRLLLTLDGVPAEQVARLEVEWPVPSLRRLTLVDTPGIASLSGDVSARTTDFLTPQDAPAQADAVVYLMRHLHASDIGFLESFRDTEASRSGTVNAVAVLSRADEIGAGRIDAMISAGVVAARYREDPTLRPLALGVVPVAGLVAQSARTMRQWEFAALSALAELDRPVRERMLLSADRFAAPSAPVDVAPERRRALLERFGIFGIRLGVALVRGGTTDPTDLAHAMVRRSGLDELLALLDAQFQARADHLKARSALVAVDHLLRERPRPGADGVAAALERVRAGAHELTELGLLAQARTTGLPLRDADDAAEAEVLLGGRGPGARERLGLTGQASDAEVRAAATDRLRRWRTLAESPLTDRAAAQVCRVVVRSCEGVLAEIAAASAGAQPPADARREGEQVRQGG
ncbi:dynamin family protein [Georgenia soli]|uniref:Dynamin family protein n=1 Tax=Georgenia soli TaxID=638953 RepID=A0A2A9EIH9_9MICO|nr:dynamin family protein [Georgenia soli]PFG38734.1 dynamin family protein [Georgenia soli]